VAGIRFEKVRKRFGDVPVIGGLDLVIGDGEFFTFVGPSGCGKSTVLNMVAGLEPVTEGKIFFDDLFVNDLSPRERDVAMVFQSYALYPHMTVYGNIAFPLRMKKAGKKEIEEEVSRISGLLGLEDLLARRPKELSGGQRQRVALGRALIRKPKVFLMDEPLSNLDARLRIEMRSELKKLHQDLGITTVYVTHDQAEALSLSDRVAVLHEGDIQQCGAPAEVYQLPANVFVGGFIGSPPMNFVAGYVRSLEPPEVYCNGIVLAPVSQALDVKGNLTIGIRPEDVVLSEKRADDSAGVTVSVVEPAGSFNWIDFLWEGTKMKGRASLDQDLKPGKEAFMRFAAEKAVLFDELSGGRLE
jgi:multiple sugar transport system ATP-binding protein